MFRFTAAVVAAALAINTASAAGVKVGDDVPKFEGLKNALDGKAISTSDLKKDIQVIVVTCNHCPVAVAYEDRLIDFTKKYKDKIDVVAICVNMEEADSLEKMTERAKEKGFNFPYLRDESQKIGRELGATVTPEFYVIHKGKVAYKGAMDDKQNASQVTKKYLEDAVDSLLKGEKVATPETKAFGCGVRYKKAN
jgi:peroxiredoxin